MDVEQFWKDTLAQNRDALSGYFCHDSVIRWHCTNEQFTVQEFIQANCDYPGEWDGIIERKHVIGDKIITVVKVFPEDKSASFHVTSFFGLKDNLISTLDEYWADDGEAPDWRKQMGIGKAIH